jgi:RNA polymerase sigma factor (sigma-70 family)
MERIRELLYKMNLETNSQMKKQITEQIMNNYLPLADEIIEKYKLLYNLEEDELKITIYEGLFLGITKYDINSNINIEEYLKNEMLDYMYEELSTKYDIQKKIIKDFLNAKAEYENNKKNNYKIGNIEQLNEVFKILMVKSTYKLKEFKKYAEEVKKEIMNKRFGLDGNRPLSYEKIAEKRINTENYGIYVNEPELEKMCKEAEKLNEIRLEIIEKYQPKINIKETLTPEEIYYKKELKESLLKILDNIDDERKKQIMIKRYGLDGDREYTYQELADIYNTVPENIRQIESRILKLLKKTKKIELEPYLNPDKETPGDKYLYRFYKKQKENTLDERIPIDNTTLIGKIIDRIIKESPEIKPESIEYLKKQIKRLKNEENQREILMLRFGLKDGNKKTYEDISEILDEDYDIIRDTGNDAILELYNKEKGIDSYYQNNKIRR